MSAVAIETWRHAFQEELPLYQLSDYPLLDACYRHWRDSCPENGLPARLDPVELPRPILSGVLLFDLERAPLQLRVRLAGTAVCDKHGGELRGRTPEEFLEPDDACLLHETALAIARSRRPSLVKRSYVAIGEWLWNYTRLILPLARKDGVTVDSFFLAVDPSTLRRNP
ncbi:PAS domain-containing protein [Tistlia consotensis]|uniref:PAS domain-containing protein n=1 Tax=Tistlia consotensis USBA 355 TaxID=560819 RepID=A0A1Y6CFY9_9PROT|nr:PAS domain-containing protein [Tistlia consotensis]SMF62919.1 PAS domain-containing protein [Tistlia consotensis USBA 355]SNR95283.1 PAS domain-containing protein [Tistlia consotensis]